MSLMKRLWFLLSAFTLVFLLTGVSMATGYQHSLTIDKMIFDWSIEGENIAIKLTAPTMGWVGIGFRPTENMKDANIILGVVKNGKVEISNEFGIEATKHIPNTKNGGKDNVTIIGGTQTGNSTTLEFSIPLRTEDAHYGVIDPKGDTVVILAYGPDMTSTKVKHQYAKTISVNLSTGIMK